MAMTMPVKYGPRAASCCPCRWICIEAAGASQDFLCGDLHAAMRIQTTVETTCWMHTHRSLMMDGWVCV